ncbi:MAG TPA: PIG-L family deacetylase [Acidobacteriaceae bacterium]|nr:PIG-L family deacetylase [Acidobacteriaceae bacterium]
MRWTVRLSILLPFTTLLAISQAAPAAMPDQPEPPAVRLPTDPASFNRGSVGLWQTLQKLHTRASLLMITAHPDDEDGPTLTYESRHDGVRANLLSLTRGEGGQNVMSSDAWDALGVVRTQELLAADRYYDVNQYWSRVADFGFTKTKQEAFDKWGYDRVLYDSVRVVRMTRPLVVMSVFAGNVSDGHGQHQVSGQMAQEVYKAAGDPKVFPDQIREGLLPWSPLKVFIRVPFADVTRQGVYDYATGHWAPAIFHNYVDGSDIHGEPSTSVAIPVGKYDPLIGLSYFQLARLGLGMQKSQNDGMGLPLAQPVMSDYHLYASRVPTKTEEATFFDGIDVSLAGIATLAPATEAPALRVKLIAIQDSVDHAIAAYSAEHPERTAPYLASGLRETNALITQIAARPWSGETGDAKNQTARQNVLFELRAKQQQFSLALAQALGLSMQAMVTRETGPSHVPVIFRGFADTFRIAIPGQKFPVQVHLANGSPVTVQIAALQLVPAPMTHDRQDAWKISQRAQAAAELGNGAATDAVFSVTVPQHPQFTQPYYHRPNIEQPYYDIDDTQYQSESNMPYPLHAVATLRYNGVEFSVEQPVETVRGQLGQGPVLEPLLVGPAISVQMAPQVAILPLTSKTLHVTASIQSNVKSPATGHLSLQLPAGWTSTPASAGFSTAKDGDIASVDFTVTPTALESRTYTLQAVAEYNSQSYRAGYRMTGYLGLRPYPIYRAATTQVRAADVRVAPGLRIGYVVGTGDEVPDSLRQLGLPPQLLSPQDLATGDLSSFDAIVLGIRAYAVRPDLRTYNDRLLRYVHQGGVLIVQYNTSGLQPSDAPYPLELGNNPEKVINEVSAVQMLQPHDPLLAWPNTISTKDFQGWVEERGHGFLRSWDAHYTPLLEMHDPGQDPQQGGLVYTRYGKGIYVYTALALYREMPEGVPGAYRLFANLISLARNPDIEKQ